MDARSRARVQARASELIPTGELRVGLDASRAAGCRHSPGPYEERTSRDRGDAVIDFENPPAPSEGSLVTVFITVRSVARSRAFYSEVLGGQVVLEENPCMVKLANSWVIMNPGGGPTPDKPDTSDVDYVARQTRSPRS